MSQVEATAVQLSPVEQLSVPRPPSRRAATIVSIAVALLILGSARGLGIEWSEIWAIPGDLRLYADLLFSSPNWDRLPTALFEMWRSVSMAWLGAMLCVVLSIPLGMVAATGIGPAWVRYPLRFVFAVIRAVPEVVIALLLLVVTGLTPLTGVLALGIAGIGTQAKWVYETVETANTGAAEAVVAAGGGLIEVIRWALWPAVSPTLVSAALYRFEINIRVSAVLGLVGAGGIGSMLTNFTNFREWDTVGMLLIVIIVVTMLLDTISGTLRRRIMEGAK